MTVHCNKNINIMFISLWKLILSWQGSFNTAMTRLVWLYFPVEKNQQVQQQKVYILKDGLENVYLLILEKLWHLDLCLLTVGELRPVLFGLGNSAPTFHLH